MKLSYFRLMLLAAAPVTVFGCGGASDGDGDGDRSPAAGTAPAGEATAVCVAVEKLDTSLDRLEDSESMDEYKTRYATVREDFELLRNASGGEYAAETQAFESALDEFEASLASLGDDGIISGLLGLAGDAADLVAAGDTLDDTIDCPGE